jgi:hypothetical protein
MKTTTLAIVTLSLLSCRSLGSSSSSPSKVIAPASVTSPSKVLKVEVDGLFTVVYLEAVYPPDTTLRFFKYGEYHATCISDPFDPNAKARCGPMERELIEFALVLVKERDDGTLVNRLINGAAPKPGDLAYPSGTRP